MTLPTSRQRPVIFPEQREHMIGHRHAEYHSVIHTPELVASDNAWHQAKANAERERILSRLHDNNTKAQFYLSNPNKNWGDNELRKPRNLHKHPELLHGGVMTTKAGQQWGFNRLKERVNELNIRASAAFGTEANQAQPSKYPGKSGAEEAIEMAMTALYDGVQAVEYTGFVVNANKVLKALYENGSTIGSRLIADYVGYAEDIKRDLIATLDQPANIIGDDVEYDRSVNAKKRVIKTAIPVMDRILRLLDLMAKTANLSEPERKQAIDSSKGRDLPEAKTRYDNTPAWTPASLYNVGEYRRSVTGFAQDQGQESDRTALPGRNPPNVPLQQVQGQRLLGPTSGQPTTIEEAKRYAPFGTQDALSPLGSPRSNSSIGDASDSWASSSNASSIDSSQAAKQAMRPEFYQGKGLGRRRQSKRGGCGECQEGEPLIGAGPGDGPLESQDAFATFKEVMRRPPVDENELIEFMKKMNSKSNQEVTDPGFAPDAKPSPEKEKETFKRFVEAFGRHPSSQEELLAYYNKLQGRGHKKPLDARARRLLGRGKPRDTEASRILKMLNDAEDEGLTGAGKKKNNSRT